MVIIVASVAMFRMLGLFALLPVLALYAAGLEGATPILIGVAVGGYGLTQAALQIPLGRLSDRIGRIPVILAGLAIFAAGSLVAAASDTIHGVIAGRFLQGAGAISATLAALLADATRVEVRTRSMAVYGIGIGASFLLALVTGPVIAAAFGVRSLFLLGAIVAAIAGALLLLLPGRAERQAPRATVGPATVLRPALLQLDLYVFLLHGLITATFVALPFLLSERLDLPIDDYWKLYVAVFTASLVGTVPLVIADDRRGARGTVRIALSLIFVGYVLLAFASSTLLMTGLALTVFFAGFNFLEAGLPARLSLIAPADTRGAALGAFSTAQFLGAFVGGVVGGWLLSGGAPTQVFLFAAVLAAAWLSLHQYMNGFRNGRESA